MTARLGHSTSAKLAAFIRTGNCRRAGVATGGIVGSVFEGEVAVRDKRLSEYYRFCLYHSRSRFELDERDPFCMGIRR